MCVRGGGWVVCVCGCERCVGGVCVCVCVSDVWVAGWGGGGVCVGVVAGWGGCVRACVCVKGEGVAHSIHISTYIYYSSNSFI